MSVRVKTPQRFERVVTDARPVCPAADFLGERPAGTTVFCGVEESLIESMRDPHTLRSFCYGDYTACPTWRDHKERVWARRRSVLEEE